MGYTATIRRDRIKIQNRSKAVEGKFAMDTSGIQWEDTCCVWAAVTWVKGMRSMNAGALDVYGVVMVRMLYTPLVTNRSRIVHEGVTYQILPETFHADRHANEIQFQAQAIVND